MKLLTALLAVSVVIMSSVGFSGAADPEAPSSKGLAIVCVGDADTEYAEMVSRHYTANFKCHVDVKERLVAVEGESVEKLLERVSALFSPADVFMVALVDSAGDKTMESRAYRDMKIALLNIASLKPAEGAKPNVYPERIQKEAMRMMGLLLGMRSCVMPLCAMYEARSDDDLDRKALNFCPPCWDRSADLLFKAGVQEPE